ncbi:MAG: glycosyl transferase family 1, partial [Bacteroidales bacterium]|nr:glycosyl transferase family 1 [Bacteroidales bacterium]
MKRVLIITYYWPPSGGSGVQRWVKFSKYLPSEGWQPVIYTPSNPEYTSVDRTLEAEISPQTEVIRRPITEPYGIYRRLMGKGSSTDMKTLTAGAAGGSVTPISSGRKSFKQRLSLWIRGNFFVPDPRIWWIRPSVRFLKKYLKEHPVDVIVTTGPPHSMHLIGEKLSKATGL